jgi:hypothetical protein
MNSKTVTKEQAERKELQRERRIEQRIITIERKSRRRDIARFGGRI